MNQQATHTETQNNPIVILTIANGAGHIRVAGGIATAIRSTKPELPVMVVDVADYMKSLTRFTHVSAYLWLVKHAPRVWDRIDRYQKKQTHTSPEWYYRRGCHRLFGLFRDIRPRAIVATEVGCCEIAALMKRDLTLDAPLVAVNDDYDADRAWVQSEVDLYCFIAEEFGKQLIANGAVRERVAIWGAPLSSGFEVPRTREHERAEICGRFSFDPALPIVLIAGGGEGIGKIEEITSRLLRLNRHDLQLLVLTGRNEGLKSRCDRVAMNAFWNCCRVLGWVGPEEMPQLMCAADLMVSKLGSMFNEALASELPIIAMEPPPGSERVQYRLLEKWNVGCAVRTVDEVVERVIRLIAEPEQIEAMRREARSHRTLGVSRRIAHWLIEATDRRSPLCKDYEWSALNPESLSREILKVETHL